MKLIGFNINNKKKFINNIDKNFFNIIDLDEINELILNDSQMNNLFKQYTKFKDNKNDKFKDIDKNMTTYWEIKFIEKIETLILNNKKNIFIGLNTHYKNFSKKINLNTLNNFIINSNYNDDVKILIEYNIDHYRENIINGTYPIEYLDFNFLIKKKENIINIFKKNGYIEKTFDEIIDLLKLIINDNQKNSNLWICLKESYNINSKIHPKNGILIAYSEPFLALIESFNFKDDEIEKNIDNTSNLLIKELKPNMLEKLKKKRFLYLVDKNQFLPLKDLNKYSTQSFVIINNKEEINNVYEYLSI